MAEQDIREDQMTVVSSVDYVRGMKGKDSVLIIPSSLMTQRGILHKSLSLSPGEQYELPYGSGLIMIQNASISYGKAVATILGDGTGIVIAEAGGLISSQKLKTVSAYLAIRLALNMLSKTQRISLKLLPLHL